MTAAGDVVIRRATPADAAALARLAALDTAPELDGDKLVAEAGGHIRAALSLSDGRAIADPFRPTAALVTLLRTRATQLMEPEARPGAGLRARLAAARA